MKILPALLLLLSPAAAAAEISGRILTPSGTPLEQARVEDANSSVHSYSDTDGRFTLPVEPPVLLLVTHPRFEDAVLQLEETPAEPVEITLGTKQQVFEQIVVSAGRYDDDEYMPVSVAATAVEPGRTKKPQSNLADAVSEVAGVAENGQGGLFQVISIRGISRGRVLTMIDGMRLITERRAGIALSFVEPLLMGEIDIVRGPASTYYGSGALGGVLQVFPRRFSEMSVEAGYSTAGDENYQVAGWGDDDWSLGLARRSADDAEAADGSRLFSRFDQYSATLSRSWQGAGREYDLLVIPTYTEDIGKANTDFPERATIYPEEEHLLVRFGITDDDGWQLYAYVHPNSLSTRTTEDDALNVVDNESFDYGASWQGQGKLGGEDGKLGVRYGVDYFGRRGVTAREVDTTLSGTGATTVLTTLDDAEEDEVAGYASLRWNIARAVVEAGGRLTWIQQSNAGFATVDRSAWSGFAGLTMPLGGGYELAANVGTGLRLPSLSERFFSGTTGRGGVIGNPDLDPERSFNTDLGIRWFGKKLFVAAFVFRNEIDDYIERIQVEPDLRTFVNLTSGTIEGIELEGFYQLDPDWRISWGGHLMDGESAAGEPLADIPPRELTTGLRHTRGAWTFEGQLGLRDGKDDPGSGEREIPSATLLSAAATRQLNERFSLTVSGSNLFDEEYFRSADDKAPLAIGRSFAVAVGWGL